MPVANWRSDRVNGRDDGRAGAAARDPNLPEFVHLADLNSDPGERVNLSEQNPELKKQLLGDLLSWADEIEVE